MEVTSKLRLFFWWFERPNFSSFGFLRDYLSSWSLDLSESTTEITKSVAVTVRSWTECLKLQTCAVKLLHGSVQRCADDVSEEPIYKVLQAGGELATNSKRQIWYFSKSYFFSSNQSCQQQNSAKLLRFHDFFQSDNFRNFSRQIKVVNSQIMQNCCVFTTFFSIS